MDLKLAICEMVGQTPSQLGNIYYKNGTSEEYAHCDYSWEGRQLAELEFNSTTHVVCQIPKPLGNAITRLGQLKGLHVGRDKDGNKISFTPYDNNIR